jgi:hypothetical protein
MDAFLVHQTQQIDRARTFAEVRRIEERLSRTARARPEAQRRAAWPFRVLAARRRSTAVSCGTEA